MIAHDICLPKKQMLTYFIGYIMYRKSIIIVVENWKMPG